MTQKTTKTVAVEKVSGLMDNGCRASDGTPYLTSSGQSAKPYGKNSVVPKGFRLKTIKYQTEVIGGGFYVNL